MSTITFRLREENKKTFEEIVENSGFSVSTVMRLFIRQVCFKGEIPKELFVHPIEIDALKKDKKEHYSKTEEKELPDMTLEEINEIIRAVRLERKNRKS